MQEYEEKKRQDVVTGNVKDPIESNSEFTFMPSKAKPVPDFKRLQKTF